LYEQDDLFEWDALGVRRVMDDPALRGIPIKDTAFQEWRARRARGEVVYSLTRDLPPDQRKWFEMQEVMSAVRVPIMVDGRWWGTVGFDHTTEERVWQHHEIDALRAAAGLIGLAIQRDRAELDRRRMAWTGCCSTPSARCRRGSPSTIATGGSSSAIRPLPISTACAPRT